MTKPTVDVRPVRVTNRRPSEDPIHRATVSQWVWAIREGVPPVRVARAIAQYAHKDQKRRYTDTPYWWHPAAVAGMVDALDWSAEAREAAVSAAWLHDVVEDTWVTLADLIHVFHRDGTEGPIVQAVRLLTDPHTPEHGNREWRKRQYQQQVARLGGPVVHAVKALDLVDNLRSIALYDTRFARVFVEEAEGYVLDHAPWEAQNLLRKELEAAKEALGLEVA